MGYFDHTAIDRSQNKSSDFHRASSNLQKVAVMPDKPNQRPIVLSDPDIRPIARPANDSSKLDEGRSVGNQSYERELLDWDALRRQSTPDKKVQE